MINHVLISLFSVQTYILYIFALLYLTIIPLALMGSELIAHEAEGGFSKIQLVGQKNIETKRNFSKTRFSRHCFGFQSRRFSLLVGYNK